MTSLQAPKYIISPASGLTLWGTHSLSLDGVGRDGSVVNEMAQHPHGCSQLSVTASSQKHTCGQNTSARKIKKQKQKQRKTTTLFKKKSTYFWVGPQMPLTQWHSLTILFARLVFPIPVYLTSLSTLAPVTP